MMKVFAISNHYPPYHLGGYEIRLQYAVDGLRAQGHVVRVLTSVYGAKTPVEENEVSRVLYQRWYGGKIPLRWWRTFLAQLRDPRVLRRELNDFQPDVIMVWGMGGLAETMLWEVSSHFCPVVYFVDDPWLLNKYKRIIRLGLPWKLLTKKIDWRHLVFVSQSLLNAYADTFPIEHATVIFGGIDTENFMDVGSPQTPPRRLLYVGAMRRAKGIHTLVEALGQLRERNHNGLTLTIIGPKTEPDYAEMLARRAAELGVESNIRFLEPVLHTSIPSIYAEHDVLILPTLNLEPLGFTIMEAQAAGIPVVATLSGGPTELITHNENGLLFRAGDVDSLANELERLITEPGLVESLRQAGMATARKLYSKHRMILAIEQYLQDAIHERAQTT